MLRISKICSGIILSFAKSNAHSIKISQDSLGLATSPQDLSQGHASRMFNDMPAQEAPRVHRRILYQFCHSVLVDPVRQRYYLLTLFEDTLQIFTKIYRKPALFGKPAHTIAILTISYCFISCGTMMHCCVTSWITIAICECFTLIRIHHCPSNVIFPIVCKMHHYITFLFSMPRLLTKAFRIQIV